MCEVIAVVNQKGGCAKTTTAVNPGIGLATAGKKVAKRKQNVLDQVNKFMLNPAKTVSSTSPTTFTE